MTLEEVKNYKSLQSYKYFTSGWVLDTKWKRYEKERTVLIMGKVKHSYAASKPPLQPWVLIKYSGTVLVAHCTCMAGLAETCSHVGAILHWIETAVRIQHSTFCTSKENQWIIPKSIKEVPYLQLSDIDFSVPKRQKLPSVSNDNPTTISTSKITPPSEDEIQDFFHKLSKEQTKSVALSVTESFSSNFICSVDYLPRVLPGIYKPTYLEKTFLNYYQLQGVFFKTE